MAEQRIEDVLDVVLDELAATQVRLDAAQQALAGAALLLDGQGLHDAANACRACLREAA